MRVIQFGLGPIGQACVRQLLSLREGGVELTGAVDIDPDKVGRDVALVCGLGGDAGVRVSSTLAEAVRAGGADVVVHTTSSFLDVVSEQLRECLEAGLNVVSSTEELSFPWAGHPDLSHQLDALARKRGVSIVGTGVNPGFVMDTLALVASSATTEVNSIRIDRVVDAGRRRLPLQRKIGAGLTPAEFEERRATGRFGHVGLRQSAQMIAAGLGWPVESLEETLEPEVDSATAAGNGDRSRLVRGIRQRVSVIAGGGRRIELLLRMFVGAEAPSDTIVVDGEPPITIHIPGGIFGDTATVAMLVNSLPRIVEASPGLRTMLDLAAPRCFNGSRHDVRTHYDAR